MSARLLFLGVMLAALWVVSSCREQKGSPSADQPVRRNVLGLPMLPDSGPPQEGALALPLTFGRYTGDLDVMSKKQNIRALVVYSRSGFFYDKGRPRGIS